MAVSSIKVALVICGLATCVAKKFPKKDFTDLDLNKDGALSTMEYYAFFDKTDTNHDGVLTITEVTATSREYYKWIFHLYDEVDGKVDGLVQRDSITKLVRILDVNGNGVEDFKEWNVDV